MSAHFDILETREPTARERDQAAGLVQAIANATQAPGWAKHLAGVDAQAVTSRAALAKLPILRKSDLPALQKNAPPFGGLNVLAPGKARRLMVSPGPIYEPEGQTEDSAGVARALFAAGVWYAMGPAGGLYSVVAMLPGFRSVNRIVYASPSIRLRTPSIQPNESASSSASE